MKANVKARARHADDAVSPVIGVILMVAITVVLAATVYVWVSGLSQESGKNENAAIRVTMGDKDGDGSNDYIKILLVRGDNAPYNEDGLTAPPPATIQNEVLLSVAGGAGTLSDANGEACTGVPPTAGTACAAGSVFGDSADDDTWDVGQTLFMQCTDGNPHSVSVAVKGTAVFEGEVDCEEATP